VTKPPSAKAANSKRAVGPAQTQRSDNHSDLQKLLGPPALLEGEDAAAYSAITAHMRSTVAPKDAIEEIWVRDIVDLVWDAMRLRRLKAKLMHTAAHEGLDAVLRPLTGTSLNDELVEGWARRDAASIEEVKRLLKKAGLDQEAIVAQTLAVKLDTFERIDRMIMQSEVRRNSILREIDRHRDVVAERLCDAAAAIEDAEFTEVTVNEQDDD
jgi:hypothetical protein